MVRAADAFLGSPVKESVIVSGVIAYTYVKLAEESSTTNPVPFTPSLQVKRHDHLTVVDKKLSLV